MKDNTHKHDAGRASAVDRRGFLGQSLVLGGGLLLAACRGKVGAGELDQGTASGDGQPCCSHDGAAAGDGNRPDASSDAEADFQIPESAYVLAASDTSEADRQKWRVDETCPATNADEVIGKYTSVAGKHVVLLPGTYSCQVEAHITFGENSKLEGTSRRGVKLVRAADGNARLQIGDVEDRGKSGVTIRNLTLSGRWALNNYCSGLTCEHVWILATLDGVTRLDPGNTGAFHSRGEAGMTLRDLTFRDCVSLFASHHGFSLHLEGAQEGGGYDNVLFEDCRALSSGTGTQNDGASNADWSCGFDIPDTGDISNLTVRRCVAYDAYQDGFHLDGSWTGHRQDQANILFEDCLAYECGKRCWEAYKAGTRDEKEKFLSGFYLQNNTVMRRCVAVRCPHSGFAIKHEEGTFQMFDCTDFESGYSLDIEYFAGGWTCENFTSVRANERAFSATCPSGTFTDFRIFNPPSSPKPVRLGTLERVDYRHCDNHASQQTSYMSTCREMSCTMQFLCNTISDKSALIEVNSSCSSGQVNLANTTVASLASAAPSMPAKPTL